MKTTIAEKFALKCVSNPGSHNRDKAYEVATHYSWAEEHDLYTFKDKSVLLIPHAVLNQPIAFEAFGKTKKRPPKSAR
jgi:hypothetical protein